jgi:Siphovirus Gp157
MSNPVLKASGPHEWRDTLAIEVLAGGGSIEDVQLLLGHKSRNFETIADRVSSMVLHVLDWLGVKKLEGRTNTLKKRKCPPSVNVIDEQKIPAEYKRVTVTLPMPQWQALLAGTSEDSRNAVLSGLRKQEITLGLDAINQALNLRECSRGSGPRD